MAPPISILFYTLLQCDIASSLLSVVGFPSLGYGWVCDYRGRDAVWFPRLNQKKRTLLLPASLSWECLPLEFGHYAVRKPRVVHADRPHREACVERNQGPPLKSQHQLSAMWVNEPSDGSCLQALSISLEPQTSQGRDKLSPLCPVCIYDPQNLWS